MKRFVIVFVSFLLVPAVYAQSGMSRPKSFAISSSREIRPPVLDIDHNTIRFEDSGGNNAIDAGESCVIRLEVHNAGTGEGKECVAKVEAQGTVDDIRLSDILIGPIPSGVSFPVEIPVYAGMDVKDGSIVFTIQITEGQGFASEPIQLTVNTRQFQAPMLQIVDYTITGSSSAKLQKRIPFDLQLLLQNTQYGRAEDVTVSVSVPDGVLLLDENLATRQFPAMSAGETKSLVYPLIAMVNYNEPTIPVRVSLKEKHGKYAEDKVVTLSLNQHLSSTKVVVDEIVEERRGNITIGYLSSAIDKDIPVTGVTNDKTFAVIIANENYQNVSDVPYAINDGGVFRNYCESTLGIPARNIHYVTNATLNNIHGEINWLENVLRSYEGQAKAIFYYAGHGIPDESSKDSYLLPVDGIGSNTRTGYKLESLYASLGSLPSQSVTVFLDACFSGANRNGEMINPNLRGVVIRANTSAPSGNMVVFSAAQNYETAIPYKEESHGMFTYFLLKKLQETAGDVTYEELIDYVQRNVRQRSSVLGKTQTPTVTPSPSIGDRWKEWKVK